MAIVMRRDFRNGTTGSLFAYEGQFIAELRSSLCLIGWPWDAADRAARDAVTEALYKARAVRPSWAEGQHAATGLEVKDSECRECGTPLRAHRVHFCCGACRSKWWRRFNAPEQEAA